MDNLKEKLKDLFTEENLRLKKRGQVLWYLLRWTLISVAIGSIIGVIGAGFFHALSYVTTWRTQYDFLLYLLPVAGLLIAAIYTANLKGQLKSVQAQRAAASYVKNGSLNVTNSRDFFLYRHVDRTEKSSSSDDRGGSSTHTSSSGAAHGGGGGKF